MMKEKSNVQNKKEKKNHHLITVEQIIALFVFVWIPGCEYMNNLNSGYSNEGSRKYLHEHQYLLITECSNPGFNKRFCCIEIMEEWNRF